MEERQQLLNEESHVVVCAAHADTIYFCRSEQSLADFVAEKAATLN
jgi:hypothetical protein